jgi:membrane-associated protein
VDWARLPELLAEIVARTGPWAPAVLFGASFLEHVFPPFPGDVLVVLGAWYAVHGELGWPAVFLAVTAGAVAGAALDWAIGHLLGPRLEARAATAGPLTAERLARFELAYRRWGPALLVANRFLPGGRALIFLAAGAARVPLWKVVVYGGISAALWNAGLLTAGALLAENADELVALFATYTRVAWAVVAVVALAIACRLLWRRRPRGAAQ